MSSSPALANRVAVVTGATQGIGRAIAMQLAIAGADVVVHGWKRREQAAQTAAEIGRMGGQSLVKMSDIAQDDQRRSLVQECWAWRGRIDIWVNNAGADVLTGSPANASFSEKLATLWAVDVVGTIELSRDVGRRMVAQGSGCILNMGWDQAEQGMEGDSGELFAASKGAIMAFTRSLARSLAPSVRVNCLAPGWIRTGWGESASPYWNQRACGEALLQRWGTPEDVARAARFLVSNDAEFITGLVLPVNGGWAGRYLPHPTTR